MPRVSAAYKKARYEQILDAAVACFAENGFQQTTMQDICVRAGLSTGAVYRYFPSKEAILEASWQRDQQARRARYSVVWQQGDTRRMLDYLLTVYTIQRTQPEAEPRMRLRVRLLGEGLRNPRIRETQRLAQESVAADLGEIIRHGQARGEINPDLDAESVARFLMALMDGLYAQKAIEPGLDIEAYVKTVREVFLGHFWVDSRSEGGT